MTVIIIIPILLVSQSYINYKINNINTSCIVEAEAFVTAITNQDNTIYLKDYLTFDCDGFYIIGPYTTSKYKHELVGDKWYLYNYYGSYLFNELLFKGDNFAESQQQLVFVKGGKVVSIAILDRNIGDFLALKESYYDISTLFFSTSNNSGNYRIIIENNN